MRRGQAQNDQESPQSRVRRSPRVARGGEKHPLVGQLTSPQERAGKRIRTLKDVAIDATKGAADTDVQTDAYSANTAATDCEDIVAELQAKITQLERTIEEHVARLDAFREASLYIPRLFYSTYSLRRTTVCARFATKRCYGLSRYRTVVCAYRIIGSCRADARRSLLEMRQLACPVCRGKITRRPVAAYSLQGAIKTLLGEEARSVRTFARWDPAWRRLQAQSNAAREVQNQSGGAGNAQPTDRDGGENGAEQTGGTSNILTRQYTIVQVGGETTVLGAQTARNGETDDSLLTYLMEYFQGRMNL
ncbi:hypothetical protein BKA62DRAFT_678835 [Auriculariales sp. MPI-PUGE-AT-0066]|nr:hypothetical protein BKA62DRAFT_679122 [Auriculariales sp. MPI-PUGE-AT-0066]KAH7074339.1 hypothetical protein BKA62DRAFT_678835 [Auriculariales sp. MPI-PUGE-AT-0066]